MRLLRLEGDVYTRLEQEVWEIATDTSYLPEWWDTAYVTPSGRFFVCFVDDDGASVSTRRKLLTRRQLLVAYLSLEHPTHCGGYHILENPDACCADLILQQALFGEILYR